jgi:copper(I)-binding protein
MGKEAAPGRFLTPLRGDPNTMRRWHVPLAFLLAGVAITGSGTASAHGYKKQAIEIIHPWIAETAGPDGSVCMTIKNSGKTDDRLVSARSSDAAAAEVVAVAGGVAMTQGLVVPAKGQLTLKMAGPHLRLSGLKRKLVAYGRLPLELNFEKAGMLALEVMVEDASEVEGPGP